MHCSGDSFKRAAASSKGAGCGLAWGVGGAPVIYTPRANRGVGRGWGCGLAWGVVSLLMIAAAVTNRGMVRVNGSVKRAILLVTTPQAMFRHNNWSISSGTCAKMVVRCVKHAP